jgi:hypothetical protein
MLVVMGIIASTQSKGTDTTTQAITQLLNYAATYPYALIRYIASDMYLHIHIDVSHSSEAQAHSRAGGDFFLSSKPLNPTKAPDPTVTPATQWIHPHSEYHHAHHPRL